EVAMQYTQRNPLPIPPGGPYEPIKATIDSVFDWQYALRQRNLLNLYEKGKTLAWNANDLDWSIDVDIERLVRQRVANGLAPMINSMLRPPVDLGDDEVVRMQLHLNAFMLSQFLHGEQGALLATAKIVQGVPWAEAKFYAANQVADEARHVEVYHRYLTEKLGQVADRKSTRLNSSHLVISYAVFCLKKKKTTCHSTISRGPCGSPPAPSRTGRFRTSTTRRSPHPACGSCSDHPRSAPAC